MEEPCGVLAAQGGQVRDTPHLQLAGINVPASVCLPIFYTCLTARCWASQLMFQSIYQPNAAACLPACRRAYADKAKWADPEQPPRHLRELFEKYVPPTLFELRRSFSHVVPLGTVNFVTTLCHILEVGGLVGWLVGGWVGGRAGGQVGGWASGRVGG